MQVEVTNTSRHCVEGATLSTAVFLVNHHGSHFVEAVSHDVARVAANSVTVLSQCYHQAAAGGVTLVFLWLRDTSGERLSRNVYWLPDGQVLHSLSYLQNNALPLALVMMSLWQSNTAEKSRIRASSWSSC